MLLAPVWPAHDIDGIVIDTISLLGQDEWNKVQHDLFGNVIPVLASKNTYSTINSTIPLVSWYQQNVMPMAMSKALLHSLNQDGQNNVQHNF